MKIIVILLLVISLLNGCATPKKWESGSFMQRYSESKRVVQTKRLAKASDMLAKGDSSGAVKMLDVICADSKVPGVTDEALFRLALLWIRPSADRPASEQGHQLLKRLQKQYPESPWTVQAAPLIELVNVAEELRHQNQNLKSANQNLETANQNLKTANQNLETANQNLKNTNQSLTNEINELNKKIEQLKHLDLELERKTR